MFLEIAFLGALIVGITLIRERNRAELRDLRARLARLEGEVRETRAELEARRTAAPLVDPPAVPVGTAPAVTQPITSPAPPVAQVPATLPSPASSPFEPVGPSGFAATASSAPLSAVESSAVGRLEQAIGGVWLQNLGAVLLLAGAFFLIVWGWTTGRFGPGVLVAAGVLAGAVLVWRGDRLRRTLPGLGAAFIGTGFGVAYVTLYLGYFTLRALPAPLAVGALVVVSALALLAGLRYRVQTIAALGVVGAYLPQLLPPLLRLSGFSLPPAALLTWIAAVGALVFALTARVGWSALDLSALVLASITWLGTHPRGDWGWPITIGLAAMFAALGLAPLPRLVRVAGRVRPIDLAVVAVAPLAFLAAAWPALAAAEPRAVAMLLFGLGALYTGAALWVDARRPERDLWRPLTGATTVFLTIALERALGTDSTPLAWTLEGLVLVALGLAPRGAWLRACGVVVLGLGAMWAAVSLVASLLREDAPFTAFAIRTLGIAAAVLVAAHLLARRRERLEGGDEHLPEFVTGLGHLVLALWFAGQASAVARAFEGPSGAWQRVPSLGQPPATVRRDGLMLALDALAWSSQAAWLAWAGWRARRVALRVTGFLFLGIATFTTILGLTAFPDPWSNDWLPVFHVPGLLLLAAALLVLLTSARLGSGRDQLSDFDRLAPEMWAFAAGLVLMAWTAREADHVARAMLGLPGAAGRILGTWPVGAVSRRAALAPVLTSVGWLVQALVTTAVGWARRSPFLRWMGLGLVGLTAAKFILFDLAAADPFWRFLSALVAGAAMLAISWVYQRKKRAAVAPTRA